MPDNEMQEPRNLNEKALDLFGALLIEKVRDTPIEVWKQTLSGTVNYSYYKQLYEKFAQTMDADQIAMVQRLTVWVIDDVIAHLLSMLAESKQIDIAVHIDGQTVPRIQDAMDLFEGANFTDEGWISRFSKVRYTELPFFAGEPSSD